MAADQPSLSHTSSEDSTDGSPSSSAQHHKKRQRHKAFCTRIDPPDSRVKICISRTEKETIVHTDSVNFRQVVHQLTGASSSSSPRHAFSASRAAQGTKPLGSLLERRKGMKNLEKLATAQLNPAMAAPVPSLTPLASHFQRICLPHSPSPRRASRPVSPGKQEVNCDEEGEGERVIPDNRFPHTAGVVTLNLFPEFPSLGPP